MFYEIAVIWQFRLGRQMEKMVDTAGVNSILFGFAINVDDASAPKSGVSLGKRLESLGKEEVVDIMSEMNNAKNSSKLPKTGSLEVLLSQYLETSDFTQIDNILNVNDRKVHSPSNSKFVDRKSDHRAIKREIRTITSRHNRPEAGSQS